MAFKLAGSFGFKAVEQARPVLLEPVMNVEVSAPSDLVGDIMGDISSRPGPRAIERGAGHDPGDPRPGSDVGDARVRESSSRA